MQLSPAKQHPKQIQLLCVCVFFKYLYNTHSEKIKITHTHKLTNKKIPHGPREAKSKAMQGQYAHDLIDVQFQMKNVCLNFLFNQMVSLSRKTLSRFVFVLITVQFSIMLFFALFGVTCNSNEQIEGMTLPPWTTLP